MASPVPGNPSQTEVLGGETGTHLQEEPLSFKSKWYFTRKEIEHSSPSRKDGIDYEHESHLRQLYCSYLQKLGMELKVPQVTIATAMVLCHRFYMHQSHAKNHWQAVANASMFLSCKAEDTPRWLKDLVVVAYKLMYSWDPSAPQRIRQREVYDKQKQLILLGEQLILVTVAFDLNIEHPYKPLVAALKRLGISQKEVVKVAWNFVNDWIRTSLCLQYKPHYIAAGSVYLAAKLQKLKLPSSNGSMWWMQFDVSPKPLEEVIQHMLQWLEHNGKKTATPAPSESKIDLKLVAGKRKSCSTEECSSSGFIDGQDSSNCSKTPTGTIQESADVNGKDEQSNCNAKDDTVKKTVKNCLSDSSSANSIVEDGDAELINGDSNQESCCKIIWVKESCQKLDIARIRERLKRRKLDKVENKKSGGNSEDDTGEAWIERELENGIELI